MRLILFRSLHLTCTRSHTRLETTNTCVIQMSLSTLASVLAPLAPIVMETAEFAAHPPLTVMIGTPKTNAMRFEYNLAD